VPGLSYPGFPAALRLLLAVMVFWPMTISADAQSGGPPLIAAASDLQFSLPLVVAAFRAASGRNVSVTFGSSGNFARQIRQGAPFQMFLSADENFVRELSAAGLTQGDGDVYGIGRIALIVPRGSPLKPDGTLADLRAALSDGRLTRFAIPNPEHAPYGRRAEQALRYAGLWEPIRDKLVLGENVSQAAQFATSGEAQGGIIAYSLALSPDVSRLGAFALIPQEWNEPLRQRMVLLKGAGETARSFYAFVKSDPGRKILERSGFVLP
jgi:molybdate transport system substrate-binding protein